MGARSSQSRGPGLNKSDGHLLEYFRQAFGAGGGGTNASVLSGLTATGGVISDYTDGSDVYRAHIFTSTGTFEVTEPGTFGDTVEYLVIGGGGGGGCGDPVSDVGGGGGGAGGLRTNLSGHPLNGGTYSIPGTFPAPYTVTIGAGGAGRVLHADLQGGDGTNSEFYLAPDSYPGANFIRGAGGGGGGSRSADVPEVQGGRNGLAGGGSGGGSWVPGATPQEGTVGSSDPNHPETAGYPGGGGTPSTPTEAMGGGGGAGGAGSAGDSGSNGGIGGLGIRVAIGGPSSDPSPIGGSGPGSGDPITTIF